MGKKKKIKKLKDKIIALEEKNFVLTNDIRILVRGQSFTERELVLAKHRMMFEQEDIIFSGIVSKIVKHGEE